MSRIPVAAISSIALVAACGGSRREEERARGKPSAAATGSIYTEVSLHVVHRFGDGKEVEVAALDGTVAERAIKPIALEIIATPLAADEAGGAGGTNIGGGLDVFGGGGGGGGGEKPAVPDGAVQLEARWRIGSEVVVVGAVSGSVCPAANTCLEREVLRIVLSGPGGASRTVERTLLELAPGTPTPAVYRRYAIEVLDREVTEADVAAAKQALSARVEPGKAALDAVKAEQGEPDLARRDRALEADVAAEAGHLIALHFATASDAASAAAAERAGVTVERPTPRVLITSFESTADGATTTISLDLRVDEVEARGDAGAAASFQLARGLAESRLEGIVLERLAGTPAVTTSRVMEAASASGIEVRVLFGAEVELPAGLPAAAAARVREALVAGHEVIVPVAAIEVDGKARWGWWDLDPATMRTIGVMESGQHQGLTEVNQAMEKLGMHPEVGFVLGGLIGTIYTAYAIAGQILKHGAITKEFLDGLLEQLTSVGCALCPQLSGEIGIKQKVLGDCFKMKVPRWSRSTSIDFCKRYNEGFKCAASLMVGALVKELHAYDVEGSAKLKIGCLEIGHTTPH